MCHLFALLHQGYGFDQTLHVTTSSIFIHKCRHVFVILMNIPEVILTSSIANEEALSYSCHTQRYSQNLEYKNTFPRLPCTSHHRANIEILRYRFPNRFVDFTSWNGFYQDLLRKKNVQNLSIHT